MVSRSETGIVRVHTFYNSAGQDSNPEQSQYYGNLPA